MVQKLVWSENALRQKLETYEYWTRRNGSKQYALRIEKEIRQWLGLLKEFPNIGNNTDFISVKTITIDSHFRLFYRITDSTIEILHFWDVRRNPEDISI